VRTAYQEQLKPTPPQERALEAILWRSRVLSTTARNNTAREQRRTGWRRGPGRSVTRFQQDAELKDLREAFAESGAIRSQVLQDVLARLDHP